MKCPKCSYDWKPNVANPVSCPKCKTRFDYVRSMRYLKICSHCSYEWEGYKPDAKACPRCKRLTAMPLVRNA